MTTPEETYRRGSVVLRGDQIPRLTADASLLQSDQSADWKHEDPWRVLRIQSEFVEGFGTLAELHPGRIDLGLGRAPGTDQVTWRALRRDPAAGHRPARPRGPPPPRARRSRPWSRASRRRRAPRRRRSDRRGPGRTARHAERRRPSSWGCAASSHAASGRGRCRRRSRWGNDASRDGRGRCPSGARA